MRATKHQKHCEGCRKDDGARFRALVNLYLCAACYAAFLKGGEVPEPEVDEVGEERRW